MTTLTPDLFVTVDGYARGKNAPANYGGAAHSDTPTKPTRNEKGTTP